MLPALRWSRKRKLSSSLTLLNFATFSFPKSCAHSQLYSSNLQFELSFLHVHTFPWQDSFALLRLLHPLCLPHLSHLRRSFTFVLNSSSVMSTSSSTMFLNTNFMASESFLAFCLRSHCVSARTTIVASSRPIGPAQLCYGNCPQCIQRWPKPCSPLTRFNMICMKLEPL